jgi:hypothetical protein
MDLETERPINVVIGQVYESANDVELIDKSSDYELVKLKDR